MCGLAGFTDYRNAITAGGLFSPRVLGRIFDRVVKGTSIDMNAVHLPYEAMTPSVLRDRLPGPPGEKAPDGTDRPSALRRTGGAELEGMLQERSRPPRLRAGSGTVS